MSFVDPSGLNLKGPGQGGCTPRYTSARAVVQMVSVVVVLAMGLFSKRGTGRVTAALGFLPVSYTFQLLAATTAGVLVTTYSPIHAAAGSQTTGGTVHLVQRVQVNTWRQPPK
jgi:hypothetical protein